MDLVLIHADGDEVSLQAITLARGLLRRAGRTRC